MINSMTAFSQVSHTVDAITADVTIRSYNSRHLDISFFCPESCQVFEENIKKMIARDHDRGRIEIRLTLRDEAADQELFEVDRQKARSYYHALESIKQDLNLTGDISLSDVVSARNVIVAAKPLWDEKRVWDAIQPAMEAASTNLGLMRKAEGENLYQDLSTRIDHIETCLKQVEKEAAAIPQAYKRRLMDRITDLTADIEGLDMVRISQEAAIISDKSDVSEEIVRLYSHIKQFRQIMDSSESQGRKLNFLIQEFNREFNTIGSKAGNAALSHMVVDLKSELEKIREQVQNIE